MKFLTGNAHLTRWATLCKASRTSSLRLAGQRTRIPSPWNGRACVVRQIATTNTWVFRSPRDGEKPGPKTQVPTVKAFGFRELGIHNVIIDSLARAYPNVKHPTLAQTEFIPAILQDRDLLLRDRTGTGKSFGIILALLNKRRVTRQKGITSLIIVPHRDLAFQMLHWIKNITSEPNTSLDTIAQAVVRDSSDPISAQISRLRENPPHMLIGTAPALCEIYDKDASALQIDTLSTIYVDEVDYLIGIPPPYIRSSAEERVWKQFKRHPKPARLLLEGILREHGRKPFKNEDDDAAESTGGYSNSVGASKEVQMIMSSATVHRNLIDFLRDEQWLNEDHTYISGRRVLEANTFSMDEQPAKAELNHHALVVRRNGKTGNLLDVQREMKQGGWKRRKALDEDLLKGPTFQQQQLETVAMIFALDVPKLALLITPQLTSGSVKEFVLKMQELGVKARPFDIRDLYEAEEDEEPTLYVAMPSAIRGVDLPSLSHVFVIGVPDFANMDVFKHIAGRVDRFGNGGTVIVLVEEAEWREREGQMRLVKNEPNLMNIFYEKVGVRPSKFDLTRLELQEPPSLK